MPKEVSKRSGTQRPEHLSNVLRHRILSGDFAPGQRLIEADLCTMFDSGRRQVREALTTLTHEGLVEMVVNRGARVRVVELSEALQLSEARFAMERLCIEHAVKRLTEADIQTLQRIGSELSKAVKGGDIFGFRQQAVELQDCIISMADQPIIGELLQGLRDRCAWTRNRLTFQPGWTQASLPHRLSLIDALCHRDSSSAVEAQRRHFELWCETMKNMTQH